MNGEDKERVGDEKRGAHLQLDLLDAEAVPADDSGPRVRVSKRARRLSLRVYPDARVEVVVPPRARPREIEDFISSHREWIDAKRKQALANRPAPEVFPPAFIELALTGERWRVHLAGGAGLPRITERGGATDGDRELRITGSGGPVALRRALRAWLMRVAADRLGPLVKERAAALGVRYARVSIRRQRSRWGSCSVRGTISLNVCLLFQRLPVVDYLIVHELTHVTHMNHSARFWRAVEAACADWRVLDRELLRGWRTVPRWMFSDN